MFIDTHCHLDFNIFNKNRENIVKSCQQLGVASFINPATQKASWDNLINISNQFKNIHICFGLHPIFIEKHIYTDLNDLEIYTDQNSKKMIGEIGLDKRIQFFNKQLVYFSNQLSITKNLNKQVIIHSVKSHNEIIKIIKNLKFKNGGIIHAFNDNYEVAQRYIDFGFKLGVGGIISHPRSKLKKTLMNINPKNIVLETDSPDMRLYNSDDKINTPTNIPKIFELVNNIYQINPVILKQQLYKSSLEFI